MTKFLVGKHPGRCKWVFTHKILMTILLAIKHDLLQRALDKSREMTILRPLWQLLNLMKVIISIATNFGWTMCQLDIKNAFIHSDFVRRVYRSQHPGFT